MNQVNGLHWLLLLILLLLLLENLRYRAFAIHIKPRRRVAVLLLLWSLKSKSETQHNSFIQLVTWKTACNSISLRGIARINLNHIYIDAMQSDRDFQFLSYSSSFP